MQKYTLFIYSNEKIILIVKMQSEELHRKVISTNQHVFTYRAHCILTLLKFPHKSN